jgi:hypothetical protein
MKPVPAALVMVLLASACSSLPEPEGPTAQPPVVTITPPPATPPRAATTATSTPAGAFEPVGTYTFTVDANGTTRAGTIAITKDVTGKLGGAVSSDMGSLPMSSVAVEGRKMTLTATIPDASVTIVFMLNFEANNDKYTGTWEVQGMTGAISGERKKS